MTFIVSSIICLIVIYLNLLSHEKTQEIYLEQTEKTIIDLKKGFLKDTVNNVFLEIDRLRESKSSNYKKNTESKLRRFQDELDLTDEQFIRFYTDTFNDKANPNMWTALLWDSESGEVLYATSDLQIETIEGEVENLKTSLSSYAELEKNNIKGMFGVSKSYIDELVKKEIEALIKSREFSGDSYIWINEIINYDGGADYAIRRVHPNLEKAEGECLSTDMEDIKGNLPYLEELEGIKKDGELFFNYYFKRLNDSEISEKITYAKLYKDYDWVIAMGVHLDDIDDYAEKIKNDINYLSSASIIRLLGYILVALLIGFIILYLIDKRSFSTSTRFLEKEMNLDTLTKAYSRRYGDKSLNTYFKQYKLVGENAAIMMFDIDAFKYVNDHYGHKVGDLVLIETVKTINHILRSSDQLIRWGGDEFICIFPGLKEENILAYGKKVLEEISSLEIPLENETIGITISIGFSYFKDTDDDYNDVLKRVDDAMYSSKKQGKNRVNID